jgi:hypothetical protein
LLAWVFGKLPDAWFDNGPGLCLTTAMPGASEQTRHVKILNANWVAGGDGDDGRFEVMIVTDDDQRHTLAPSPAAMTALIALARADTVLLWDPTNRTLIAANVVGQMPWTEDS